MTQKTLQQHIEDFWMKGVGEIVNVNPYGSVALIAIGIETLGKILDYESSWYLENASRRHFQYAIHTLDKLADYRPWAMCDPPVEKPKVKQLDTLDPNLLSFDSASYNLHVQSLCSSLSAYEADVNSEVAARTLTTGPSVPTSGSVNSSNLVYGASGSAPAMSGMTSAPNNGCATDIADNATFSTSATPPIPDHYFYTPAPSISALTPGVNPDEEAKAKKEIKRLREEIRSVQLRRKISGLADNPNLDNAARELQQLAQGFRSTEPIKSDLYSTLRCGMAHSGFPGSSLKLSENSPSAIKEDANGDLVVNVNLLYKNFHDACKELIDLSEGDANLKQRLKDVVMLIEENES